MKYKHQLPGLLLAGLSIVGLSTFLPSAPALAEEGSTPAPSGDAAPSVPGAEAILSGGHGGPTPPAGGPGSTSKELSGQFAGGLLFEEIDDDYFVTIDLYNTLSIGPVSFGVWVPLRLRVKDNDPQNDGVFRSEDWDEVSDWARLFRFVEVNLGGETWRFRGRIGALDGESIGHGTILGGYYNAVDRNHYQSGLALSGAIKYGGAEMMLDNLLAPEIFGFRLHLRPTSFFTENRWANKLAIGLSMIGDVDAPLTLRWSDPDNDGGYAAEVTDEGNYRLESSDALLIYGVDVEYTLLQNKLIDLVPYIDLNFIGDVRTGVGFHAGVFFNLRLPTPVGPTLLTRLEYRAVGDGYAPRYVDSLYEAQRVMVGPDIFDPAANDRPLTKLEWLRTAETGANGILGELYFDFAGWIRVGGAYEDYSGDNNSALTLSLLLPKIKAVQLGAYYTNRGFDSMSDAFDLETALLRAFARVRAWGPIYLSATYTRTWVIDANDGNKYIAEGNWSVGLSMVFTY
ncbi:MAG: hypothetical protein JRH20_20435 [Deltaproteobacteria bacterium]|nr:hypothetical protein [Deltaproteobacteria bacterium]